MQEVAIKKLFRQNVDLKILEEFKKEVYIMSRIPHPNVLLLMGACTTPGKMALVTELCAKVHPYLNDNRYLPCICWTSFLR